MTYKVDETTHFWGGNLGYAKAVVAAKTAPRTNKMMTTMLLTTPEEVEAWTQLERNRINEAGAKIDKDVQEGLISGEAVKFDQGKRDWSLLPYDSIEEIIKVLEFGAKKYNEPGQGPDTWNWAKGAGLGKWRTLAAIFRHLTSYAKGETYDPESGLNHLAHVGCGVLFLLHYHGNPKQYGKLD